MLLSSAATRLGTHYAASTLPQSTVVVNRVTIEKPANEITTQTDLRRYCARLFFEIFDQLLRIIPLSLILWKNVERFYIQFDDKYLYKKRYYICIHLYLYSNIHMYFLKKSRSNISLHFSYILSCYIKYEKNKVI